MALEAQNNPFTSVLMVEAADPEAIGDADPSAGQRRLVVGTDHILYLVSDSGVKTAVGGGGIANPLATDSLWDAAGDLVQGSGANTAAKLSAGTAGHVLTSNGAAAAVSWQAPGASSYVSGELDYVAATSNVNVTATTEATANTVVTGSAVAYSGSEVVMVEFWCDHAGPAAGLNDVRFWLYDGSSSIGFIAYNQADGASQNQYVPIHGMRRITPSAATHTYSIRASVSAGTGIVAAGAGGNGNVAPMFIRIYKV